MKFLASSDSQDYGCPGLSLIGSAIAIAEVARVDASCSTFILVHSSLAMLTIGNNLVSFHVNNSLNFSCFICIQRYDVNSS